MKRLYLTSVFKFLIFFAILFFCSLRSIAQETCAEVKIAKNEIFIGEQVNLSSAIKIPLNIENYLLPDIENDTAFKFLEFLSKTPLDTFEINEKFLKLGFTYTITSFDTGKHTLPSMDFKYIEPQTNDTIFLKSDSLLFSVNLVPVDTTQTIMDIKGTWDVPFQWKDYIWYAVFGLLFIIVMLIGVYFFMKRRKGIPIFPLSKEEKLPPHEEAYIALEKIKKERIWKSGMVKLYYTQLTDVLRNYIEKRFGIQAMESTSSEIITDLDGKEIEDSAKLDLRHILETSDVVKFAKAIPIETEHLKCIDLAYDFVDKTKFISDAITDDINNKVINSQNDNI